MLNIYQKQLMAQGFLLRLAECENNKQKEALVVELMDEMVMNNHSQSVSRMQYEVDREAKELDGRFDFERRQE